MRNACNTKTLFGSVRQCVAMRKNVRQRKTTMHMNLFSSFWSLARKAVLHLLGHLTPAALLDDQRANTIATPSITITNQAAQLLPGHLPSSLERQLSFGETTMAYMHHSATAQPVLVQKVPAAVTTMPRKPSKVVLQRWCSTRP